MRVSDAGRRFIEAQEGLALETYWDVDGWSIGYGHHSPGVIQGMQITRETADALLTGDLAWVEAAVTHLVVVPTRQAQFDALADFVYNEGAGALSSSTALRLLNAGDQPGAADALLMWDKSKQGGKLAVNPALLARRKAERAMFLSA